MSNGRNEKGVLDFIPSTQLAHLQFCAPHKLAGSVITRSQFSSVIGQINRFAAL